MQYLTFIIYSVIILEVSSNVMKNNVDLCSNLVCNEKVPVCSIRAEGAGFVMKLFENECEIIKKGCGRDNKLNYEIIGLQYCDSAFNTKSNHKSKINNNIDKCLLTNCPYSVDKALICGLRQDGDGFRVHQFKGKCDMWEHNCRNNVEFIEDDDYLCEEPKESLEDENNYLEEIVPTNITLEADNPDTQKEITAPKESNEDKNTENQETVQDESLIEINTTQTSVSESSVAHNEVNEDKPILPEEIPVETFTTEQKFMESTDVNNSTIQKREAPLVVIVDNMITFKHKNISRRIDDFFETTHIFDLPLQQVSEETTKDGRRMWIRNAGPIKVFKPWVVVPKNVSELTNDMYHMPTLSTCYHRCPFKCPKTYAPVCGVPGTIAREPSLMFQNHCFMDVAQCKMRWEDKSDTAASSGYKESSFLFCMGDELSSLYRFLPLIRTLQHMGRLKKKGYFREKIINMRFLNNIITRQPNLMG